MSPAPNAFPPIHTALQNQVTEQRCLIKSWLSDLVPFDNQVTFELFSHQAMT